MSVLVTGAGGFIGSHLTADQARRGRHVTALDLHLGGVRPPGGEGRVRCLAGDIGDPAMRRAALEGVDTVFHLAAAHLAVTAGEDEFRRVNVEATRALAEDALDAGVRRFVHCSTVGVHGTVSGPPADEDSPCRPEIAYERTKLEGERALLALHGERGLPLVVLRPVWIYGPGCPRTAKLFRSIGRGRFVVAGSGGARRHCLYIRDMLDAFELAATSETALGHVIITGDREAATVDTLVGEIVRLTDGRRPWRVPVPLLWSAGLLAELVFRPLGKEPPLSRRTVKFFTANTAFDTRRSRELLGFEPRYDLASGLAETWRLLADGRS